jgi:hypothetical protein
MRLSIYLFWHFLFSLILLFILTDPRADYTYSPLPTFAPMYTPMSPADMQDWSDNFEENWQRQENYGAGSGYEGSSEAGNGEHYSWELGTPDNATETIIIVDPYEGVKYW